MKFQKTKHEIAICPYFIWKSEHEHCEEDVSISFCTHINNDEDNEGNCRKELCPLVKKNLVELHELSPEPLYNGKDYFDNEELKQEQESEREQDDQKL